MGTVAILAQGSRLVCVSATTPSEDEEAAVEADAANQARAGQEEPQGWRQEGRLRCEEEGHRSLRPGELEREPCSDLRGQEDASHGGHQETLGLHQEELVERGQNHYSRCQAEGCPSGRQG